MSKEQFQIYAGYFLITLMTVVEIWLGVIIKKSWDDKTLRVRNYLFIFCLAFGAFGLIAVIISQLYKVGLLG
ncbi:hypothetical protein BIY24_02020 [Halobacteriovorax marinus]|uniref:hypothetical protein n=1 Tax=Halobacteriovorax marinus TaxID=97084 RepID=UPI000BC34321|nr:hypothetical protein [Halobacteriovorax marinus]ATH06758.1 hypothetical protein BIY24_02020 [Halobacteriovorax marinus]